MCNVIRPEAEVERHNFIAAPHIAGQDWTSHSTSESQTEEAGQRTVHCRVVWPPLVEDSPRKFSAFLIPPLTLHCTTKSNDADKRPKD